MDRRLMVNFVRSSSPAIRNRGKGISYYGICEPLSNM